MTLSMTYDTLMTLVKFEKYFTEEDYIPICDYLFENLGRAVWYTDNFKNKSEGVIKYTSEVYKSHKLTYNQAELLAGMVFTKPVTFEALFLGLLIGNT